MHWLLDGTTSSCCLQDDVLNVHCLITMSEDTSPRRPTRRRVRSKYRIIGLLLLGITCMIATAAGGVYMVFNIIIPRLVEIDTHDKVVVKFSCATCAISTGSIPIIY